MKSKVRNKGTSGCFLVVFFSLFALAGSLFFVFLAVLPGYSIFAARSWVEVPCRINSSEVDVSSGDDSDTYRVALTYSYTYDGRTYDSERYDFSMGYSSGYEAKARVVEAYPPDFETVCFVDPDDPAEAVINRSPGGYLWWGLFPLPFMAVGFGGLLFLLSARGHRTPEVKTRGRSGPPRGALGGAGASQTLKADASPRGKLVVVIFMAAFWNGIVSIFVFGQLIPSFRRGDPEWFLAIFMIPFILVGVGLILAIFYFFLALFNPRFDIELTDSHLTTGEKCSIRWHFEGRYDRFRKLTISFEGRESATYRRGTSSVTEHSTFYSQELLSTDHPAGFARGTLDLEIPQRTMPSFKSSNNKIEWFIAVHGDIPFWPDVNESFAVTVHPALQGRAS